MIHILLNGIIENFRSRSDKSMKLEISTLEHNPEMLSTLSQLHQLNAQIYISTGEVTEEQKSIIDKDKKEVDKFDNKSNKSPSQKLRSVLYLCYSADIDRAKSYDDFDDYYNNEIRVITDHYKSKLDNV